jgi:hypothetical protein
MAEVDRLLERIRHVRFVMPKIALFDAIYSARALRRLKPDPVPEEIITRILDDSSTFLRRSGHAPRGPPRSGSSKLPD